MTSKYAYDTLVLTIGKLVNTLDKEEFRIKLEEINRLVEKKNYKDAMEVVDSIDSVSYTHLTLPTTERV